jgi:hypothetical protein
MSEEPDQEPPEALGIGPDLGEDAVVQQLRPSPSDPPPEVVEVYGYLGRDTEDGYWRLYLSAGLDSYLRIAEADIVSRSAGQDAAGRDVSHLVVRAAAPVDTVRSMTAMHASFLRGAYTDSLLGTAGPGGEAPDTGTRRPRRVRAEGFDPVSVIFICTPPHITIDYQDCLTIFCPTTPVICPVTQSE